VPCWCACRHSSTRTSKSSRGQSPCNCCCAAAESYSGTRHSWCCGHNDAFYCSSSGSAKWFEINCKLSGTAVVRAIVPPTTATSSSSTATSHITVIWLLQQQPSVSTHASKGHVSTSITAGAPTITSDTRKGVYLCMSAKVCIWHVQYRQTCCSVYSFPAPPCVLAGVTSVQHYISGSTCRTTISGCHHLWKCWDAPRHCQLCVCRRGGSLGTCH
jgi:hypothetical protein